MISKMSMLYWMSSRLTATKKSILLVSIGEWCPASLDMYSFIRHKAYSMVSSAFNSGGTSEEYLAKADWQKRGLLSEWFQTHRWTF